MTGVDLVPVPSEGQWDTLRKLVVYSVRAVHSRRAYGWALDEFFRWYRAADRGPFRKALVQGYRELCSPLSSATNEAALRANGGVVRSIL